MNAQYDVLVVGGGPGGSATATLLAQRGWRVLLAEKEHHPRFHIGESLLPANMPLLDELGVLDKVRKLGVLKLGADFPTSEDGYRTYHFARALGRTPPYAFQVKREDYDAMLFEHAGLCGADARQGLRVDTVALDQGGVTAQVTDDAGNAREIRARYLVDASGRDTFLSKKLKLKAKNTAHQSAAIFAHFRDVQLRPGDDAGNISIYRFAHGWCWFIPLRDGLMSIGCVCFPTYLKQRRGRTAEFLLETLQTMPEAWARMGNAQIVGETRVAGNYSYTSSSMSGKRWLMVGDAYAFVDPIFSSGVYLAMHSARQAVEVIDGTLRDPSRETALQRAFEKRIRRGLRRFSWFIYRFNTPVMRRLFADPRNHYQLEQGVISMLAGDVFDNGAVYRRLLAFKAVYAAGGIISPLHWLRAWRQRRRQARVEFTGGTTAQDYL